jgi:hypothetical protein
MSTSSISGWRRYLRWLYQDVVHGDESTTGDLGIVERYRAAVGVFAPTPRYLVADA